MPYTPLSSRFSPACTGNSIWICESRLAPPVQPRVYGELRLRRVYTRDQAGSAPRVRGTRLYRLTRTLSARFSPACTGNSDTKTNSFAQAPVQPRVYGELATMCPTRRCLAGSAPRVRGTQSGYASLASPRRFSPACTGNSHPALIAKWRRSVQPRVYGELRLRRVYTRDQAGSAPRVRGTRLYRLTRTLSARFSPACTGNSDTKTNSFAQAPVQPRVYGELRLRRVYTRDQAGSAPRVRGTRLYRLTRTLSARFSPACTGNSDTKTNSFAQAPVQPRVYGELLACFWTLCAMIGSAPRVRGTRLRASVDRCGPRFSPACTGNSAYRPKLTNVWPVQPRVYGELRIARERAWMKPGSAPRVRGTLETTPKSKIPSRFSPACTGNSFFFPIASTYRTVQPRVYGELSGGARHPEEDIGSAPRVRGTRTIKNQNRKHVRFSPACTGNSIAYRGILCHQAVQPRVYGELPDKA